MSGHIATVSTYLIKVKARSFVEEGFRNQTWITVDFGDHTYSVRNVHGVAKTQNVEYNIE